MFNWHSPSVNPSPRLTPAPWFPALFLPVWFAGLSLFVFVPFIFTPFLPAPFSIRLSLLCSGVRPAYTNNRVPVLQRCGGQKEPLSPGHGARDGARGASQGGLKDGARKLMRECDGGHCGPPILTQTKGYPGERFGPGFGPTRKRPFCPKAEQEETEREDVERVSHPEKRARISTGENFLNMPRHTNATYIFLKSPPPLALFRLLFMNLSNSGRSYPFILSCAELILIKKSFNFFCYFLPPNQFHLKPAPSPTYPHHPRLLPLSVPSFALCGSQLREVFNPAFERSARQKRGRGTAILSLFS